METELVAARDPSNKQMVMRCPKCGWVAYAEVVWMPESPLQRNVLLLAHELLRNELRGHPCILGTVV